MGWRTSQFQTIVFILIALVLLSTSLYIYTTYNTANTSLLDQAPSLDLQFNSTTEPPTLIPTPAPEEEEEDSEAPTLAIEEEPTQDPKCSNIKSMPMKWGFPFENDTRPHLTDRVSIMNFKQMAEVSFLASHEQPLGYDLPPSILGFLDCLKPGTVVITDTVNAVPFMERIRPLLKVPVVMVTTDLDPSPDMTKLWQTIENDSMILAWFFSNSDLDPNILKQNTTKLFPIPLGLSQWHGVENLIDNFNDEFADSYSKGGRTIFNYDKVRVSEEKPSVGLGYSLYEGVRTYAWNTFCKKSESQRQDLAELAICTERFVVTDQWERYKAYSKSDFGLSLRGVGVDCYRTWEMLFTGVWPIVLPSSLDPLYEGLPVLIVESIDSINASLLSKTREQFLKDFNFYWENPDQDPFSRLYMSYWRKLAWSFRPKKASNIVYVYE